MDTDLNFPPGLIASPYFERERSTLPVSVGSMPGVPLKPTDIDILMPGRGVIPGSAKYEYIPLGLVKSKRYPDADTYSGRAYEGTIQFHTPRLEFLNNVVEWVATKVVEAQTRLKGGKMLSLNIWISEDTWGILPTYRWTLQWNFYIPGVSLGVASASATAIITIIASLLALIALIFILKQVKEIIWGPPTNGRPPGVIPSLTTLLMVGGGLALAGIVLMKPKVKKRKKK